MTTRTSKRGKLPASRLLPAGPRAGLRAKRVSGGDGTPTLHDASPRPAEASLGRRETTVTDLCTAMDKIAPRFASAEEDNVGLVAGGFSWPVTQVLLTIDLTPAVLDEAIENRCDAIISYHPPLYRPTENMIVERVTTAGVAAEALSHRIAIYSPHTALDAAPGGTNDVIAELCGLVNSIPFDAAPNPATNGKLVVFVPDRHVEEVADAVFAAGGGMIGGYSQCSFRLAGHGTFLGGESTKPVVGEKGLLERVDEVRLEIIFPMHRLREVVAAVRKAHPYEEPAFDVYPLQSLPLPRLGQGRIGKFPKPIKLAALARSLKAKTRAANVTICGDPRAELRRGFVCVGAAGGLPFAAKAEPCGAHDVIITGEIRHHDALRYQRCGAAAVALGHWASERPALAPLAAKLKDRLAGVDVSVSRADRDPFIPL